MQIRIMTQARVYGTELRVVINNEDPNDVMVIDEQTGKEIMRIYN